MGKSKLRRKWWREKPGSKPASPRLDALKASEAVRRTHGSLASLPQSPPFDCLEPPLSRSIYPPQPSGTPQTGLPNLLQHLPRCTRPARCNNCSIAKAKHPRPDARTMPSACEVQRVPRPVPGRAQGLPAGTPQHRWREATVQPNQGSSGSDPQKQPSGPKSVCFRHSYGYCASNAHLPSGSPKHSKLSEHPELYELHGPFEHHPDPALTRVEIQVPATPREGGESAKRTTDSPVSQTRASKRSRTAPGQMNLKLLSRNSVRKARVEDAMDTDDDDVAATTQLIEATDPFSNE
ncbi:hypothetical protein DID88_008113 [Monilinia fructigena]|uniref:Uncharacterized protein n=1 Tax=Monilinia fructigena TaxID=38457 RepID=A0A395J5D2_9HELO|nr:hypothetical protein DID88_008113 [Monilinia fructigena]